jgi:hypothetical protein
VGRGPVSSVIQKKKKKKKKKKNEPRGFTRTCIERVTPN